VTNRMPSQLMVAQPQVLDPSVMQFPCSPAVSVDNCSMALFPVFGVRLLTISLSATDALGKADGDAAGPTDGDAAAKPDTPAKPDAAKDATNDVAMADVPEVVANQFACSNVSKIRTNCQVVVRKGRRVQCCI
jgi:hypothetical protein